MIWIKAYLECPLEWELGRIEARIGLRMMPTLLQWGMPRPQKITFGQMRFSGVRGLLIYCSDYRCSPLDRDQRRSMA